MLVPHPAVLAVAALVAFISFAPPGPEESPPPHLIPALQQWTNLLGAYRFSAESRVIADRSYAPDLGSTPSVFAADLAAMTGNTAPLVIASDAQARPGDLLLTLGSMDASLGREGYRLTVGSFVTIQASSEDGVFNGTRTVLQLLKQSWTIPEGVGRDWADYPDRGLMIDAGRKYFSMQFLEDEIRDMAYLKLNYLHLHLSDSPGFRLESATHPEIVSALHYSKQEIADLVALASRYHVTIVPEIDMPAHMDAILAVHPELRLTSSGHTARSYLDLSNPASYGLVEDLTQEYMPLFPGPYWDLGADEYVTDYASYPQLLGYARSHYGPASTAKDAYYGFINWVDGLVRASGKTLRIWNDGIGAGDGTVPLDKDIAVDYWLENDVMPQQLVDLGHPILNRNDSDLYYVLRPGDHGAKPDDRYLYESWSPNIFHGGTMLSNPFLSQGAALQVWCDYPDVETESDIAGGIMATLRVLAQQTWGSPKGAQGYAPFQEIINAVGHAPGYGIPPGAYPASTQAAQPDHPVQRAPSKAVTVAV